MNVVSGLLGWVGLGPAVTDSPIAPIDVPTPWALFEWARRQIAGVFFNQSPVIGYDPLKNSQSEDGVVTGDLEADDDEGDPLSYAVTKAPAKGTVEVSQDGTFIYKPGSDLAAAGGTDTFTVKVADSGFHLHGLFGFFAPDLGHSTEQVITVTVEAAPTNTAPVADPAAITREPGDVKTGAVTGSLGVSDPDGDGLTYTVVGEPADGRVTIDAATGTYTYVPTTAARLAAGAETAPAPIELARVAAAVAAATAADQFTVQVSDGQNPPIVVTVGNIPIAPLQMNVGPPLSLDGDQPAAPLGTVIADSHGQGYVYDLATQSVRIIDPDGSQRSIVVGQVFGSQAIAVSPDGSKLYVANADMVDQTGGVGVYDTATGAKITDIPLTRVPLTITAANDGQIYVFGTSVQVVDNSPVYDNALIRIDGASNTLVGDVALVGDKYLLTLTPSADSSRLYATRLDPTAQGTPLIAIIDAATGEETLLDVAGQIPDYFTSSSATPSPDDTRLYVAVSTSNSDGEVAFHLAVFDVDPESADYLDVLNMLDHNNLGTFVPFGPITFSEDGSVAYLAGAGVRDDGTTGFGIAVVDTRDNSVITTRAVDIWPMGGIAMSSDGAHGYVLGPEQDANGELGDAWFVSTITIGAPASSAPVSVAV